MYWLTWWNWLSTFYYCAIIDKNFWFKLITYLVQLRIKVILVSFIILLLSLYLKLLLLFDQRLLLIFFSVFNFNHVVMFTRLTKEWQCINNIPFSFIWWLRNNFYSFLFLYHLLFTILSYNHNCFYFWLSYNLNRFFFWVWFWISLVNLYILISTGLQIKIVIYIAILRSVNYIRLLVA